MSLGNKARELVAEDVNAENRRRVRDANPGWHTIDAIDQINGILRAHCRSGYIRRAVQYQSLRGICKLLRRPALKQVLNNFSTIYDEPEAQGEREKDFFATHKAWNLELLRRKRQIKASAVVVTWRPVY
uniref:Uncharacterized protein n=1 Tax=Coccidioides posadasii RMSCC 3488 TaxID=454284 RepID=A0A0J6F568_COCPO|nr:hypothetical protein CPAG_00792 [Coccidioides posadasii RMSCC 3488]